MRQSTQRSYPRVLVVEDNVITSQEIRRQLTNLGYTLTENAYSGQEAIDKAIQSHPDLVLMDIHLGEGIDGTEAAERIWTSLKIPVVYLTAYTDSETLRKAQISEPFGYVLKPFDERTLYVAIETALSKHQAELLLAQQKSLLTEVFEHVQEGIALVDEYGMILYCNPGYAAIVGERLPENLVGENVFRFFDQEARKMLVEEMKTRKRGYDSAYELPLISVQEDRRWVRMSVSPRFDEQQQWIGEFVTMLDITDRKRIELELQRAKKAADQARQKAESANAAKGEFLAHLSHELRTPLNAILGYAQLMLRYTVANEQVHKAVDTILRSGEHLLTLINNVLDFSKIEARKIELNEPLFSLSRFLKDLLDMIQVQTHGKMVHFTCHFDPDLPPRICGDETRLRQVLMNLLNNALKFTERGQVAFRVKKIADRQDDPSEIAIIRFEVEDTGIGIAPEQIDRIFLPFSQGSSKHTAFRGTGLGLPICQNLLHMMGSDLSVESHPGQGSRFWFDLEAAVFRETESSSGPQRITASESINRRDYDQTIIGFYGQPMTMLIVDDHDMNRAVIRDMLQGIGFTMLEASNGFDGLEKARIFSPDVILMDLMMPALDGFETVRQLREQSEFQDALILGISASVSEEVRTRCIAAGCNAFLPKPLELRSVLDLLEQYLNLEWIYQEGVGDHDRESERFPYEPFRWMTITPPSQEQLLQLYESARSGDIAGLRAILPKLAGEDPVLIPFLDRLHDLVKGFQMNDIKAFLESYLQNGHRDA